MTQCSPCYSAVSASLMDHLPDCSNYSPHSPNQYFTSLVGLTLYQTTLLETNTSLLQHFTAEVFRDIPQCLEEAEQADASGDVPPPLLQIVISTPFCLFLNSLSLYHLSAPFLNPPFPHFHYPLYHPFFLF